MTPNERREFEDLKRKVDVMQRGLDPLFIKAIEEFATFSASGPSSKSVASGTQTVSEGGVASYPVMKAPTGFIRIDGKNVPYIT